MDLAATTTEAPPSQLPLPLPGLPPPSDERPLPPSAVAPADLWPTLWPTHGRQVRTTATRILQEVVNEPQRLGEDHPAPS